MLRRRLFYSLVPLLLIALLAGIVMRSRLGIGSPTAETLRAWFRAPEVRPTLISRFATPCPNAPFLLPSEGFVGFLYGDPTAPYTPFAPHTGIDIFGDGAPGTVPVRAAYDGYLTRLPEWRSTIIIRHPSDPLQPDRQIWTYYTHMASENGAQSYIVDDFPPGTHEKFVKRGTLLGYQGLYSGAPYRIGMHVHFSVVLSAPDGSFRNETQIGNTLDPSPYLGFNADASRNPSIPVRCGS
jgi:murein DD-endopeptidase MepM/ murein hydrolase activator NlpD